MKTHRTAADIGATIQEMDQQYDANFGEWIRTEDNIDILAINLKRYIEEYNEETFAEVLKWITECWSLVSRIALLKKLFSSLIFREDTLQQTEKSKKYVKILKIATAVWSAAHLSELILEFLVDLRKEEKKTFLLWLLEDCSQKKLTEIFIRVDNIIDWSLKIAIIKNGKVGFTTD